MELVTALSNVQGLAVVAVALMLGLGALGAAIGVGLLGGNSSKGWRASRSSRTSSSVFFLLRVSLTPCP